VYKRQVAQNASGQDWIDLWVHDKFDKIMADPWKIRVLEEFDEDEVDVRRPDADAKVEGGMYGTVQTTEHMRQEAVKYKKEFGRNK
jgi:hypothetical protein